MENIQVSVIIPFYKSSGTIRRTVKSVLRQKNVRLEVIIIDDGNTLDRSTIQFDGADEAKIRVISLAQNKGVAYARNAGVKAAKGTYIAFLDADDWWAEDKLSRQLKLLQEYSHREGEPLICFTGRRLCTDEGIVTDKYIHAPQRVDYSSLLKHNAISCSSVLLRRETALAHPMGHDGIHEDYICWLEILQSGGYAAGIDEPLLFYRVNHHSKSGNKIKSAVMTYRVYRYLNLPFYKRIYYFISYAINGIKKYR